MFENNAKGCERDKKGHFSDTPFAADVLDVSHTIWTLDTA